MPTSRICLTFALCFIAGALAHAGDATPFSALQPRPSGFTEPNAPPGPLKLDFSGESETAGVTYDVVAHFPKGTSPFRVETVKVNDIPAEQFLVANQGILNGHHVVNGNEDFTVSVYANWQPSTEYTVTVEGTAESGERVQVAAAEKAPDKRGDTSMSYDGPTVEFPYHHVALNVSAEILAAGKVKSVAVDGKKSRDLRYFNSGKSRLQMYKKDGPAAGENYDGIVDGTRNFRVTAPLSWLNGSMHSMQLTVVDDAGKETVYSAEAAAPASGGYWSADWPHSLSLVVEETAGLTREQEPVHAMVGLFADDITKPENEIRVVTYDPTHPKAGPDGWVVAPVQVTNVSVWRDERLLNSDEKDPETGEHVHRYDATTTVELVFFADVAAYEQKVYYIVYGNPNADRPAVDTQLKVTKGEGMSETVDNAAYSYYLSKNSGAVETVTVLGEGDPIVLEHKLETNGAVHWNPGFYSPPTPWVHVSDWETPIFDAINGPLMYRTRRYAPFPHMDSVNASVTYAFYSGKPYVLMSSFMETNKDMFVQAMRNGEVVFNHAVLNEFVWENPLGKVESLDIESSRKHPIHALEIPADTPWMAFISRDKKVGFANIALAYENGNRYGQPKSEAQPYFYVQNGPWIYWSRPIVYPFGGMNFTRMMPVRAGTFCLEENAWVAFRFAEGSDPFAGIKTLQKELTNPLRVHEWMATDDRTPESWVMPILTMPFNEGVAGAISGHKATDDEKKKE